MEEEQNKNDLSDTDNAQVRAEEGQMTTEDQQRSSGENLPNDDKKSFVKKISIILLVLLAIIVLIVAAFYFFKKSEKDFENEQTKQENREVSEVQKQANEQKLEEYANEENLMLSEDDSLSLQKEIARSAVPPVTVCLDQGGYVEEPSDENLVCRDDVELGFWSAHGELGELGGSWGGCEMKIKRDPVEFEYCMTLSSGQIYGCTEGGCSLRDMAGEESVSTEQGYEAVDQAEGILETQNRASEICRSKIDQFGDTKKAREEAVAEIKRLPGAKDAGISEDGSVWIEHVSGVEGIISLNPQGTL